MAVINIEKEMPESCGMCDHRTVCTVFGKGWTDANNRYSLGVHSRLDDCPLKSVDRLIKRLKDLEESCASDSYGKAMAHAMDTAIKEVKKYCGVKE